MQDAESWGPWHRLLLVLAPVPFIVLVIMSLKKAGAFTESVDRLPYIALAFIIGRLGNSK